MQLNSALKRNAIVIKINQTNELEHGYHQSLLLCESRFIQCHASSTLKYDLHYTQNIVVKSQTPIPLKNI